MDETDKQWNVGQTHGTVHKYLHTCFAFASDVFAKVWSVKSCQIDSAVNDWVCVYSRGFFTHTGHVEIWYKCAVLENHRSYCGGKNSQTSAAEEHPDRRCSAKIGTTDLI